MINIKNLKVSSVDNYIKSTMYLHMSLKRKIDESEDKTVNKKQKTIPELNYPEILKLLSHVDNSITEYLKIFYNADSFDLKTKLTSTKNSIPRIVVWGSQSVGKSSILKKMFSVDLQCGTGTVTKCPIEIRVGPMYQEQKFYVEKNQFRQECKNIQEAQNLIASHGIQFNKDYKIIAEFLFNEALVIVDLPGFIEGHDYYFQWLKQNYLNKPETVIIHILRGDCDPKPDVSIRYIANLDNKKITVLTNTDMWIGKPDKLGYLAHHLLMSNDIALVNNQSDEIKLLDEFKEIELLKNFKGKLTLGSDRLKSEIFENLRNKITEQLPHIKNLITEILNAFDKEFQRIGYVKPGMNDECYSFKRQIRDALHKEFNECGHDLAKQLTQLETRLSPNNIYSLIHECVPDVNTLAQQMSSGSRRKVKGSEGWDEVIKKYITDLVKKTQNKITDTYINDYFEKLHTVLDQSLINIQIRPSAFKVRDNFIIKNKEIIQLIKNKAHEQINEFMERITFVPYNAGDANENFTSDIIYEALEKAIDHLYCSRDRASVVDSAFKNKKDFCKLIASQLTKEQTNLYQPKAKIALAQIHNLWNLQSKEINTEITNYMIKFEKMLEDGLYAELDKFSSNDFSEPDDVDKRRSMLLDIKNICEQIIYNTESITS